MPKENNPAGLNILLSVVVLLFLIGLVVMIFTLMGGGIGDATRTSTSGSEVNESFLFSDGGTTLSQTSDVVSLVVLDGEGATIPSANYTEVDGLVTGNHFLNGDYIQISTCLELQDIESALTSNYVLTQNIDCSATTGWNGGAGFVPLSWFEGTLQGNGYNITDLYIFRNNTQSVGLINGLAGTIDNVGLINVDISGRSDVGGFVGYSDVGSLINNSFVEGGSIKGGIGYSHSYGSNTGGLIGYADGTVANCYNTATIISVGDGVGGIVGHNYGELIYNCYNTGDVLGWDGAGGILGWSSSTGGSVYNSWNSGYVNASTGAGGIAGWLTANVTNSYNYGLVEGTDIYQGGVSGHNDSGLTYNSYYDEQTSGQSGDNAQGIPLTTAEMKTQRNYSGWDFADLWEMDVAGNNGYPNFQDLPFISNEPYGYNGTTAYASYDWSSTQESQAGQVMSDTSEGIAGVTNWFPIIIVITAMIVLILLTVIIITSIRGSGLIASA